MMAEGGWRSILARGVRMGITKGFSWGTRYNEETPPSTLHLGTLKGQVKGHQKPSQVC